jgi:acyl-coenzyme A thioesterase PaaI-like protein
MSADWAEPGVEAPVDPPPGPDDSDEAWTAWANGTPAVRAMAMVCEVLGQASAVFGLRRAPFPNNRSGAVNGGMVASACDQAVGLLASRNALPGMRPVTATLHLQYHGLALPPLTLRAAMLPGGKRTMFLEVVVFDHEGRRCASCQASTVQVGAAQNRDDR